MKNFLTSAAAVLNRISVLALWLSGICLIAMTVTIAYQVFGRYVLNDTPSWAEALSVTFMGWFIFLGAAVGVHERTHLGFDVLILVVPPRAKLILRMLSDLVVCGFGMGMIYYGLELTIETWDAIRPTLGIPDGARYIPLTLGGVLITIFSLRSILARLIDPEQESDLQTLQVDKG